MTMEFTPPVTRVDILHTAQYPDGRVCALTALVFDSLDHQYTLTLSTAANLISSAQDVDGDPLALLDQDHERVFVIPSMEVDPTTVEEILESVSPELLSQYLSPQET